MPTVSFQQKITETEKGKTILDSLLNSGIDYPHGCLNGTCGVCIMRIKNPESLEPAGAVERDTLSNFDGENMRLGCRAKVKDVDVIISAPKK